MHLLILSICHFRMNSELSALYEEVVLTISGISSPSCQFQRDVTRAYESQ